MKHIPKNNVVKKLKLPKLKWNCSNFTLFQSHRQTEKKNNYTTTWSTNTKDYKLIRIYRIRCIFLLAVASVTSNTDDELQRYSKQRQWIQECRRLPFRLWFHQNLRSDDKKATYIHICVSLTFLFIYHTFVSLQFIACYNTYYVPLKSMHHIHYFPSCNLFLFFTH